MSPWAVSALVARFGAAGNMKVTARDLRTGLAFGRVKHAHVDGDGVENHMAVSLAGGWTVDSRTYANDYVHPAYFNALLGHLVRLCELCMH